MATMAVMGGASTFKFPASYDYPPMWTVQQAGATRRRQLQRWAGLVQAYCRHERVWQLSMVEALGTPLFRNARIRKTLALAEVQAIVDFMASDDGQRRAEWVTKGDRTSAWIYWRRPEEWAETIAAWVDRTGQKNTVLTLFEITQGEATTQEDFYGMDPVLLQKSLNVLVARGKAQVFGAENSRGIKFF